MQWIIDNKEWIFSGVGISILSILIRLFTKRKTKNITMKQKSGANSTNIQIGGDYNAK